MINTKESKRRSGKRWQQALIGELWAQWFILWEMRNVRDSKEIRSDSTGAQPRPRRPRLLALPVDQDKYCIWIYLGERAESRNDKDKYNRTAFLLWPHYRYLEHESAGVSYPQYMLYITN